MAKFYPAKRDPRLVGSLQRLTPWLLRWFYQVELVLSTEPSVPLAILQDHPCLLLCNHPTFVDPMVMFLLSGVVQRSFYYLAAHERFGGLEGWLFQRIGAYSIRRGQADRDSIAYTLKLLTQTDCKLVIFPEGGCSFQNDTVMPFRPGAIQMALQALSKIEDRDFYVVPISLKYRYTGQMTPIIEKTLRKLEQALQVLPQGGYYDRLRRVAAAVMQRFEQEYGLDYSATHPELTDWNQRIIRLKSQVLSQCEQRLQLSANPNEPNRERVYRIQRAIETRSLAGEKGEIAVNATGHQVNNKSDYNSPNHSGNHPGENLLAGGEDWEMMRRSLSRVLNFDAIYDGYVAERPTPERFLDTLTRLERAVFEIDQPSAKGYRQAFLRIGQPVNLRQYRQVYQHDRTATVQDLTHQLQQTVQRNLNTLSEATARDISW